MMLELSSNKVKVLGIFGRLTTQQELFFDSIEQKFSNKPSGNTYDIFRHLTLTYIENASIIDLQNQLKLLKNLKEFLPLKVKIKNVFIKNEESMPGAEHIAIEFDPSETNNILNFIRKKCGSKTVATGYIKLVWFVPKENQAKAIDELSKIKELEFSDFFLVSNKQDEQNTIFKSTDF